MKDQSAYILKRSKRARRLRMSVYCDGAVVVTAPSIMDQGVIERFVQAQSAWVARALKRFAGFSGIILPKRTAKDFALHKGRALELAQNRLEHFNRHYGFTYRKITIRNQRSRWGSCSRNGNLSFNYKIALLPPHLADYIIVHELCHLGAFNHSPIFWALVKQTIPYYKEARRLLRKSGTGYY